MPEWTCSNPEAAFSFVVPFLLLDFPFGTRRDGHVRYAERFYVQSV